MQGKIALEEHFAIPDTLMDSAGFVPDAYWPELKDRLLDIQDRRLAQMDAHGIEMMILSLNAPAVQAIPDVAARQRDCASAPTIFSPSRSRNGPTASRRFAALPMQDPDLAITRARALRQDARLPRRAGQRLLADRRRQDGRSITTCRNTGRSGRRSNRLDVPFYLHPRNPLPEDCAIYEGHPWLMGPTWAFGQETAVHALRLMGSGLFDAYPKLKIILGHMGEGLPYSMWRVDHRNGWVKAPPKHKAKKKICDYFNANFFLTTSGNFRTQTLIDSILEIGADRILFSVDWPFENVDHASDWFNSASISENDRVKIGRRNAIDLFKLDLGESAIAEHGIHQAAE